ncbi:hypothetical protein TELCIR_02919 [Teladorsagia circumcincta]|uniref:Uncharacterized protein n=1 Tax=Teladorsagia circumcincta TaxID=45464 RepID=A0A2G9UXT8_TELCI|nr:hypothetical protein TELCIR_02919 [Teladorsagia circumcincta]
MEECEALCSCIGILCQGKLVDTGTSQMLKSRYANNFVLQLVLKSLAEKDEVVRAISEEFPKSTLMTTQKDVVNLKWHITVSEDGEAEKHSKHTGQHLTVPRQSLNIDEEKS